MKPKASHILHVKHLHKSYGALKAVNDLSFDVKQSTCFGILGPNGAGKTTMMKMIYGMACRDSHSETRMDIFGYDPANQELEIKYLSGVVPQENNLDEELNVTQNLRVYAKFYGMNKFQSSERIDELLDFFELADKAKSKIRELSGGMKRRLVIARALLHTPRLLILDEPTTGLDPQVRHLIWDKLRQLKKEGLTILLTTHYMEEAFQLCDSILIIDKGKKLIEGAPQKLLDAHVEKFVLEILTDRAEAALKSQPVPASVRRDDTQQRMVFLSEGLDALRKISDGLNPGDFYLRQSNLEDLFLKMTGRELNASQ